MASEKVFPERRRCKRCGRSLGANGAPVYFGLYDTPHCAGIADPPTDVTRAPRGCRSMHDGSWHFKRRYRSVGEIPDIIRRDPTSAWYVCETCGHIHIGHSRIKADESVRKLRDRAALADVIVKARGDASVRDVAEAAGVRPIRLKEWEDPGFDHGDVDALFAVLRVLHLSLAVTFERH